MTLWLYLHFPCLQLDTLLQDPSIPAAVVDGRQHQVVALNARATACGIKPGMGLATAASLCRDIRLLPYRRELELDKLRELAQWLYCISADIVLDEPKGLLLRVTPMLKLYGSLPRYWQAVCAVLEPLQINYQYATAYSPLAASLLAQTGFNQLLVDAHKLKSSWSGCTLQQTPLASETIEKLQRVGLHRVADLLEIPLKDLSRRFSGELVHYLGRLTGELRHPVDFYHPPEAFRQYLELWYDIETLQALQSPLKHLLKVLEHFLRLRDRETTHIEWQLHQRDLPAQKISVGSAQGEYRADKWLELSRLTLENQHLKAPVYALSLHATQLHDKATNSEDLFAGKQGKLSDWQLVSLLQARLGKNRVSGLARADDFRPELASKECPPLPVAKEIATPPLLRPSLLLPEPQLLQEPVAIIQGPERIATGWWDNQDLVRDYYIARNKSGQWYWIFRTPDMALDRQHWYLHGYFS